MGWILGVLWLFILPSLAAETLTEGPFELTTGKGFQLLSPENGLSLLKTPAGRPVFFRAVERGEDTNWEAQLLEVLLTAESPEQISIKKERGWTTFYWTYGGTRAYFAMGWWEGASAQAALLFWADPVKASGERQYQALSEVTKGVVVRPHPVTKPN